MPARLAIAALVAIFVALSCYRQQEVPPGDRPDSDSDSDTDSDGDSDTDSDSDSDSDTDTDTDADGDCGECPVNSGFPCPCEPELSTCGDGSLCGILADPEQNTSGHGVCALPCSIPDDFGTCEVGMGCDAVGQCKLTAGDDYFCGYICSVDGDCPANMYCDGSIEEFSICYGY